MVIRNKLRILDDLEFSIKHVAATYDGPNYAVKQEQWNKLHNYMRSRIKMATVKMEAKCDRVNSSKGFKYGQQILPSR